jgi:bacterioferritin
MKGNQRIVDALNQLLVDELTAINQYMVHSEMAENWGYEPLHKMVEKRAFVEMRHAEKLIERILFLDGIPIVSRLDDIHIGADVPKMFDNDLGLEMTAIRHYNDAIALAMEVHDGATRELLEHIIRDEDAHVDEIEAQQDQISQMGVGTYLGHQIRNAD